MAKTTTVTQEDRPETVIGAIQHLELVCQDPKKARTFLEKQFGWTFETQKMPTGDYHMFRTDNGNGGGVIAPQKGQPIAAVPYVNVEDCDTELRNIKKAGCEIVVPTVEVPGMGKYFQFRVPGGPVLGCWGNLPQNE